MLLTFNAQEIKLLETFFFYLHKGGWNIFLDFVP